MKLELGALTLTVDEVAQPHFLPYLSWFKQVGNQGCGDAQRVEALLRWNDKASRFLVEWQQSPKPLQLQVEMSEFEAPHPNMIKRGPLNQAIGKKSRALIDATGGWGNDSLLLAAQGYKVATIERHPLLATLLHQAFKHFGTQQNEIDVHFGSADKVLPTLPESFDCVYFDPMFPVKRKKSAKSNKQMQFCQALLTGDDDAAAVLQSIRQQGDYRIVVKRPKYAEPLIPKPNDTFSGSLINYDVYLGQ